MKVSKILYFGLFISTAVCCKKDNQLPEKYPLSGNTAIFVGTWSWIYSEHYYNWCDPPSAFEIVTPMSSGNIFKIRFLENGLVDIYKNNILYSEYRIALTYFKLDGTCNLVNSVHYGISLDESDKSDLYGCINSDTMTLYNFPGFLFQSEWGCESYENYFIKE